MMKEAKLWNVGGLWTLGVSIALSSTGLGCGSSNDSPGGAGGSSGHSGTGGAFSAPSCDGALAKLDAPYSPNSGLDDLSVFIADERGLIFNALPDSNLGENTSDMPTLLMASDFTGHLTQLRETTTGFFSNLVFDGDDVIFTEGFLGRKIVRMPRAGGAGTVLDEDIRLGAVADDSSLYYFADGDSGGVALFSLPRAGGTRKLLSTRGSVVLRGFAIDGQTLYWGESKSILSDDPVNVYSLRVDASEPTLIAAVPSDNAGGLNVSGGLVFSTLLTDSLDIDTYRIEMGKPPTLMGETGLPFILADGKAYYGASGGLTRNTLTFDSPSVVSGTSGKTIYAIASGPSDLWYGTLGCLFKTPK